MSVDPLSLTTQVVLLQSSTDSTIGTGFVIYADEQHAYVVTCYHVVSDAGGIDALKVNQSPATLIAYDITEGGLDIAVLQIGVDSSVPIIAPGHLNYVAGIPFSCVGYSRIAKVNSAEPVRGVLGETRSIRSSTLKIDIIGWELLCNGAALQKGYSGAPAIDGNGNVFGVVSAKENDGKSGLAIGIAALLHIWPNMPDGLRARLSEPRSKIYARSPGLPPLMNFNSERDLFFQIIRGEDRTTRLIAVKGQAGTGKSRLLTEYQAMCAAEHIESSRWDCKTQIQPEDILDAACYFYGGSTFNQYNNLRAGAAHQSQDQWYKSLTHAFITNLMQIENPRTLVLLFDHYECADWLLRNWLSQTLLPRLESIPLVMVVAGQESIPNNVLQHRRHEFPLTGVSLREYCSFTEECGADIPMQEIELLHKASQGQPKLIVDWVSLRRQEVG